MKRMMTGIGIWFLLPVLIGVSGTAFGQTSLASWGAWNLQSTNGLIGIQAHRRGETRLVGGKIHEQRILSDLVMNLVLNTTSYVWHPDFLLLQIDTELNPNLQRQTFLRTPDLSLAKTVERFNFKSTFFQNLPYSIALYSNLSHSFTYRENLGSVETKQSRIGNRLTLSHDGFRLYGVQSLEKWTQKEWELGRKFENGRYQVDAELTKSVWRHNRNKLKYRYQNVSRVFGNNVRIRNRISNLTMENTVSTDVSRQTNLSSVVWYYQQNGTSRLSRLRVSENIRARLPGGFRMIGVFNLSGSKRMRDQSRQRRMNLQLQHQLYRSLSSRVYLYSVRGTQTTFVDRERARGFSVDYSKNIPTGSLSVSYMLETSEKSRIDYDVDLRVIDEEVILNDLRITLLSLPFVDRASVLVTDASKTIIYEEGFDYLLIERDAFLEVRRIPGSQILDGESVTVDYFARPEFFRYDARRNNLGVRVMLFNKLIELYYQSSAFEVESFEGVRPDIVKTMSRKVVGAKVTFGGITLGVHQDDFDSNLLPYNMMQYRLSVEKQVSSRLLVFLSGDVQDKALVDQDEKLENSNLFGRVRYDFRDGTAFDLTARYRRQKGSRIDLELKTVTASYTMSFNRVMFSLTLAYYVRDYSGTQLSYASGRLNLTRYF